MALKFNQTQTLKPYGSSSTVSTFATLSSSIASSNSILYDMQSFKTANTTFSNTLVKTPSSWLDKTYRNDQMNQSHKVRIKKLLKT